MILRKIIDSSVAMLGWLLRMRKCKTRGDELVKVNLGCGLALASGWINVDASFNALFAGSNVWLIKILYKISGANRYYSVEEYVKILSQNTFVFHDLSRSLPFNARTVDYFYSSHFFEHLFKRDAIRLLGECYEALKPGGVIRIAVPDLEYAVNQYRDGRKKEMLENYFFVDDLSSYLARHKYMYDFEIIFEILIEAGFRKVVKCGYQKGNTPDLDVLDNRPEETLFVEAVK